MKQPQKRLRCENQQVRVVSVCVQMEQHPLLPGRPVRVVASVDVAVASMCYFYAQAKNKSSRSSSSSEEKSKCKAKAAAHLNICRVTIIFISHAAQPALPPAC